MTQDGVQEKVDQEQGGLGRTVALIAEDLLRWVMVKVTLGVAALAALAGLAAESPHPALKVAAVLTGVGAFVWALAEVVRGSTTRRRQWTFIGTVLTACSGLLAAALLW